MTNTRSTGYLVMAALVLISSIMIVTPVLGEKQDPKAFIFQMGDVNNPLDLGKLLEQRDSLIRCYRNTSNLKWTGIGIGNPVIPENAKIVAYGYSFDNNGVPHQIIAAIQGESNSSFLQKKAKEWYESNIVNPPGGGIKTSSDGWPWVAADEYYYESPPYGLVEHNWEMYKNNYETDPTRDYFAIKQIWTMDPGFRRYRDIGSKWINNQGLSYIDWGVFNTFGSPALHDRDPLGTTSGPGSVSISLNPSPQLSWSFPLNAITISDQSDPVIKRAQWSYAFNSPEVKNTIQGWQPGSSASMNQHSSGTYDLAYLFAQGKFVDPTTWPNYQYWYIWTYWYLWYWY